MVELSINPLIISKIKELDESDEFKELLLNLLDFEKLRNNLGDKEYTKEYDRRITDFVNKRKNYENLMYIDIDKFVEFGSE